MAVSDVVVGTEPLSNSYAGAKFSWKNIALGVVRSSTGGTNVKNIDVAETHFSLLQAPRKAALSNFFTPECVNRCRKGFFTAKAWSARTYLCAVTAACGLHHDFVAALKQIVGNPYNLRETFGYKSKSSINTRV